MKKYTAVARGEELFSFFHTSEKDGKEIFPEITTTPSIVVLMDFDKKKFIYTEPIEALGEFLNKHRYPLVSEFDQEAVNVVFQKSTKKGVLLIAPADVDQKIKDEFKKLALVKKSDEFMFVYADSKSEWGTRLVSFLALTDADLPRVEVLEVRGEVKRYRFTGEMTEEALNKFIDDFKNGWIPRFFKSEEIPTENPGPVFKVVGKTFKQEVIDNDSDVLVKFYAEWCGHCKQLAPIYTAVAESLKNNKKIKLVDIDATKNDVEGISVQGFPTLKFWKGKDKTAPIDFEGERTEEGILKFLKEKASNPIEEPKKDL
jgi:protein disulfide isomerase